jgi:RadC-like JAB domain
MTATVYVCAHLGDGLRETAERLRRQAAELQALSARFERWAGEAGAGWCSVHDDVAVPYATGDEPAPGPPGPKRRRPRVRTPEDIVALLGPRLAVLEQEQLWALHLDSGNGVIGEALVVQGSPNQAPVRVADVFREAIRAGAVAVALCHNHPSGASAESRADVALTRDLVAAGRLLDVEVLDHVIVGEAEYRSLRRAGVGFDR